MKAYKKVVGLVSVSLYLFSPFVHSQDPGPTTHKNVMWKMQSPHDEWWRDKARKIWDQDLITVERRKKCTPETFRLASFRSSDQNLGGYLKPLTDIVAFPVRPLYLDRIEDAFTAWPTLAFAHESVHFFKDDDRGREDYIILSEAGKTDNDYYSSDNQESIDRYVKNFEEGKHMVTFNLTNGVLPGDKNADRVLTDDQQKEKLFIIRREAYADLKALELLQQNMPDSFHTYLHRINQKHVKNLHSGLGGKYLDNDEKLFCWGLYQQRKKDLEIDSDVVLNEVIDHYLNHRNTYKTAMQSLHFLRKFNKERNRSLSGSADNNFNLVRLGLNASEEIELGSFIFALGGMVSVSYGLLVSPLTISSLAMSAGGICAYMAIRVDRLKIKEKIVCSLGRAYNSSYVWNRDRFTESLGTDVARVATLATRLIKRDGQLKLQREKDRALCMDKQETKSVRSWFEKFNTFA